MERETERDSYRAFDFLWSQAACACTLCLYARIHPTTEPGARKEPRQGRRREIFSPQRPSALGVRAKVKKTRYKETGRDLHLYP